MWRFQPLSIHFFRYTLQQTLYYFSTLFKYSFFILFLSLIFLHSLSSLRCLLLLHLAKLSTKQSQNFQIWTPIKIWTTNKTLQQIWTTNNRLLKAKPGWGRLAQGRDSQPLPLQAETYAATPLGWDPPVGFDENGSTEKRKKKKGRERKKIVKMKKKKLYIGLVKNNKQTRWRVFSNFSFVKSYCSILVIWRVRWKVAGAINLYFGFPYVEIQTQKAHCWKCF